MNRRQILLLVVAMMMVASTYAQNWLKKGISGEGPTVTETWNLSTISGIGLAFSGEVILTQGSIQSVEVEGQKNILDNIKREVKDGYWSIKFDQNVRRHENVTVRITLPSLERVAISGSGKVSSTNHFRSHQDLDLSISGSGSLSLSIDAADARVRISGSGEADLEGRAETLDLSISGSGDLHAYNFKVSSAKARISGSGDADLYVDRDLSASVSGSGDIRYKGGASNVTSKTSGSGRVKAM